MPLFYLLRLCSYDCTKAHVTGRPNWAKQSGAAVCAARSGDMYLYGAHWYADGFACAWGVLYASGQVSSKRFSGVSAMWHWCLGRPAAVPRDKQQPLTHQGTKQGLDSRFARRTGWSRATIWRCTRMRLMYDAERALHHH
jgi:hypothetical protein